MSDEDAGGLSDSGEGGRPEHEGGEYGPLDLHSLRETFSERRISLHTMDAPLRLATGGAVASLVGAALLIALRDAGSSQVTLLPTGGVRTTLGAPLFDAALVLLALGLGYIATGAVFAHRVVAFLALATMTVAIAYETGVLGFGLRAVLPHWGFLATRALLAAIWVIAIAASVWRRSRHGDAAEDRLLRLTVLVLYCAVFGGYLLVLRVASPMLNGLSLFPGSITLLMGGLSIVAVPILTVAAVDFGEWGQLTGERLLALVPRRRVRLDARRGALPVACCLSLLVLAWLLPHGSPAHRLHQLGLGVALFALFVAILVLAGLAARLRRQCWPDTLNFAALFAVVALNVWVIAVGVAVLQGQIKLTVSPEVSTSGGFSAAADVRSLRGADGFSVLIPAGWQPSVTNGTTIFRDLDPRYGALALAVDSIRLDGATVQELAAEAQDRPLGPVIADGPLQQLRLVPSAGQTAHLLGLYRLPASNTGYLIIGVQSAGRDPAGAVALLGAELRSFRPPGVRPDRPPSETDTSTPAAVAQANADRSVVVGDSVAIVLGLTGLVLVAGRGRRWPSRLRGVVLLFGTVTLGAVFYGADSFGRVLVGPHTRWRVLSLSGVLAGLAVFGLVLLACAAHSTSRWAVRLPRTLTGLLSGVLALRGVQVLYDHALAASRTAVWAAVIVLVAIAWDVTMSGESLTNHSSRLVPRSSRVLLFFGYVILLAGAVVFYSGQRLLGSGAQVSEVFFEPESITQAGLFGLGMPLLLLLFLLRTFGDDDPARTPPGPESTPRHVATATPEPAAATLLATSGPSVTSGPSGTSR
ncbi:MAG TPA: hypothetical protein VIG48_08235 [Jatrophihabitans sp.]